MAYSPLGRGFLTGAIDKGTNIEAQVALAQQLVQRSYIEPITGRDKLHRQGEIWPLPI